MRQFILAALLAAPAFASAATNLVINGGFEANLQNANTWNIYSNLTGWTGGSAGIELRNNVAGAAFEGKNFVELDTTANSAMWQQIATKAGQHYNLSFAYSGRPGVAATSNNIEVLWNGVVLGDLTAVGSSVNNWGMKSYEVIGINGMSTLTFRAAGKSDSYGGSLDAVSLTTSPVPEPGTYALMLGGLAAMGLLRRRQQQKAM